MRKFSMTALGVSAALATAVAGASLVPQAAQAETVKCYGIAKAGENDCGNKAAGHSCAGHSEVDYSGMDFKAVEKEQCMEMGGKTEPFEGINQNVKS